MHYFSSIQIHLLKVRKLWSPVMKAEMLRKSVNGFYFRNRILILRFPSGITNLPIDPVFFKNGLVLS